MVLKVKNSRSLVAIIIIITFFFIFIYSKNYSYKSTSHTNNFLENYESLVRDSLMRISYGLKDSLGQVEPTDEICVVGIDDQAINKYGKFGSPLWGLRVPFNDYFAYMQKYFPPKCIALDVILKQDSGSILTETGESGVSEDSELLLKLSKSLKQYSETFEGLDGTALLKMSTLVSEQGETYLGSIFARLQDPFGMDLPKVPVLTAYSLEENERDYLKDNTTKGVDYFKWTTLHVVGEDPLAENESLGTAIPYLKKVSIPNEKISKIPNDYVYLPHANLVSQNFIDFISLAFVNVRRDSDGIVRRIPLVLATKYLSPIDNKLHSLFLPSMSLMSCLKYWGASTKDVEIIFGKHIKVSTPSGERVIPIDKYGRIQANFTFRPKDMNYISFAKVNEFGAGLSKQGEEAFDGEYKKSLAFMRQALTNKIALVGLNFTGNSDIGPTAIDTNLSLVYVHAAAINSMLKEEYLTSISDTQAISITIVLFVLLGAASLLMSINGFSLIFIITEVTILGISFGGVYYSWHYVPTIYFVSYSFSIFLFVVLFRYFSEEKEKLKIRNMFSTMVSSSVLDYMEEHPESFSLTGSKMPATMMFSDVAGFTTISEGLTPEKLVLLLNKYLTPMTDIIQGLNGYVDKYEGDAIMAEWGVPFPNEKHATLACYACLDQQKKLDEIREDLYKEFGYQLTVRMGVNSGEVSAGNMGSVNRFSYTVMGDAVNLAARLEPTNKVYGTYIMIGENTYDLAKDDIEARLIDKVVVVGKKVAIRVYELLARKGELSEEKIKMVKHYEKGLELHEERKWDEAIAEFKKALEIEPEDQASKVMIERVEEYKVNPPGDDWQGEYVRKSKD